jgi:hypothetical protein
VVHLLVQSRCATAGKLLSLDERVAGTLEPVRGQPVLIRVPGNIVCIPSTACTRHCPLSEKGIAPARAMAIRLREEDLGKCEVLGRALGFASCPRLLRITGQTHVSPKMAQRVPRAVVVMPTRAECPPHVLSSVKRWHMRV